MKRVEEVKKKQVARGCPRLLSVGGEAGALG